MNHSLRNLILLAVAASPLVAYPHVGHDHGEAEFASDGAFGPVTITERIARNLDLEVAEVDIQPLGRTVRALGRLETIPNRIASVSSRVGGRVVSISIEPDTFVEEGSEVMVVESLQVGDPPPRITLTAPVSGYVVSLPVARGDVIQPNQRLAEIADTTQLYAVGYAYERDGELLEEGQAVRIRLAGNNRSVHESTIAGRASQLEAGAPVWRFWAPLPNPEGRLRPHMRATLDVVVEENEFAMVVPRSAILGEMGNYFVFTQSFDDPMTYEPHQVVLGLRDDRYVEVIEGAVPGDLVVTRGNYQLQFVMGVSPDNGAPSGGAREDHAHDHDHVHWWTHPLFWMGSALGALLLVNAGLLYFRR